MEIQKVQKIVADALQGQVPDERRQKCASDVVLALTKNGLIAYAEDAAYYARQAGALSGIIVMAIDDLNGIAETNIEPHLRRVALQKIADMLQEGLAKTGYFDQSD
jgi:hypothetical protein